MNRSGVSMAPVAETVPRERRAYARHMACGNVLCSTLDERADSANQPTLLAQLIDLSRNGALVEVPERFEAGARLRLKFFTPLGTPCFSTLAEVRAVAPRSGGRWQVGCAFKNPVAESDVAPFTA